MILEIFVNGTPPPAITRSNVIVLSIVAISTKLTLEVLEASRLGIQIVRYDVLVFSTPIIGRRIVKGAFVIVRFEIRCFITPKGCRQWPIERSFS